MDCTSTAAQSRLLYVPPTVTSSGHMEVKQQSGTLGPQADPHLEDRKPDVPDSNSHIWIIEETHFADRNMVQKVNFQNAIFSFYLVKNIGMDQ